MKHLFLLCLLALPFGSFAQDSIPRYLFFLHNRFLENHSLTDKHDEYGRAEYAEIVKRFEGLGFKVISELRSGNTDGEKYAEKVVHQIDSLKALKVPSGNITVVGTSKGGFIAQYVSSMAEDPEINFVFIGSFFEEDAKNTSGKPWIGRICNIYESSDVGSTSAVKKVESNAGLILEFYELKLNTGRKHGFLYKALDEWIVPAANWGKGTLKQDSLDVSVKAESELLRLYGAWKYNKDDESPAFGICGNTGYGWGWGPKEKIYDRYEKSEDNWTVYSMGTKLVFHFEWISEDEVIFHLVGGDQSFHCYRTVVPNQ